MKSSFSEMANTRAHHLTSIALSVTVLLTGTMTGHQVQGALIALGALFGIAVSPDWDWDSVLVEHRDTGKRYILLERGPRKSEKFVRRVYGIVARYWPPPVRWWIFLYARLFRHRGVSHHPLFGTPLRLVWLVAPVFLTLQHPEALFVWLGLWMSDLFHLLLDWL